MEYMVDTKDYLIHCRKLNPTAMVSIRDCSACEYHRGIMLVWPGIDGKEVDVEIGNVTLEPTASGKMPLYEIICGLPSRLRAQVFVDLHQVN